MSDRQELTQDRVSALFHYRAETGALIWKARPRDDGDRDNNRENNLVAATSLDNKKNRRLPRNNTSGVIGVTWCKQTQKWRAQMTVDRKMVHIGRFDAFEDAVAARKAKEKELAFHINHGSDERPRYV